MKGYRDPLKAGLFGVLMPGGGHVYAGRVWRGMTFFAGTVVGLFLFVVPGLAIWAAGVADAVHCTRRRNAQAPALDLPPERSPLADPPLPRITDGPPVPDSPVDPMREHPDRSTAP